MKQHCMVLAALACCMTMVLAGCGNNGGGGENPSPVVEEEGWVDLGLPSGLLWATCNLGATSPEGYGAYYAWGETTTKSTYKWETYTLCNGGSNLITKYCNKSSYGYNGYTDSRTNLEAMDDAATQALGGGARIPTEAEWEELISNTTAEGATMNGVDGRKFTASNGASLFLPAAGCRWDGELDYAGTLGHYWSATLYESSPNGAWRFYFYSGGQCMFDGSRGYGRSVRAVRSAQ